MELGACMFSGYLDDQITANVVVKLGANMYAG